MIFKNRKTSVVAVLALLLVIQIVFSGMNSGNSGKTTQVASRDSDETVTTDNSAALITEEEVVSADLNVVYRSTVTATEEAVDTDNSVDGGDFGNKVISYTCDELNVYAQADNTSEVVGVMFSGSEGDIVERGTEWTKITSGAVTGYVRNVDVLFGAEAATVAEAIGSKNATVTVDNLPVLANADAGSEQISTLAKGAVIDAYEETDGFILIICDNGYGYIDKSCVTLSYGLDTAMTKAEIEQQEAEERAAAAAEASRAAQQAAANAAAAAQAAGSAITTTTRGGYSASEDEVHLLAAIVYWESGWEPAEGQLAVANVVLNRVLSSRFSQNSITGVVYAANQFSGVSVNGAPSERFQAVLNMSNEQLNQRGCYDAAVKALSGQNNVGDLMFFINVRKANYARYSSYTVINNHCFYTY